MGKSITSKGKAWEWMNSFWMLWAIVTMGFLNFISFFYIAYRVKQKKWTKAGIIYSIPFVLYMIVEGSILVDSLLINLIFALLMISWIVSVFHVLKIRPEYLLRLETYKKAENEGLNHLKNKIASEYKNSSFETDKAKQQEIMKLENRNKTVPTTQNEDRQFEKVDLNRATEEEMAAISPLGIILAKKAIVKREEAGAFRSVEHFGETLGLKPHVLERIRPFVFVSDQPEIKNSNSKGGRIIDF